MNTIFLMDITIERLQRQLTELMQIMVDNRLMRPAETATPRQTKGRIKEPTVPPREGRDKKQHKMHVSLDNRTDSKTMKTSKRRGSPE